MVATELALAVATLRRKPWWWIWFIEKQMEKRNVRLSREGAVGGYKDMFLDAKGNVIPGKHQISSQ
jgi:hypothetical protein